MPALFENLHLGRESEAGTPSARAAKAERAVRGLQLIMTAGQPAEAVTGRPKQICNEIRGLPKFN